MEKLRLALFLLGMLLAASLALSRGASSKNMTGQLQSITISPPLPRRDFPVSRFSSPPPATTTPPLTQSRRNQPPGSVPSKRSHDCGVCHLQGPGSMRGSQRTDHRIFDLRIRPDQLQRDHRLRRRLHGRRYRTTQLLGQPGSCESSADRSKSLVSPANKISSSLHVRDLSS